MVQQHSKMCDRERFLLVVKVSTDAQGNGLWRTDCPVWEKGCPMEKYEANRNQDALMSVTVDPNGYRIHRLIDDVVCPVRCTSALVKRDPMVEALFGPAIVARPKKKR
jgi:hypothetical protein